MTAVAAILLLAVCGAFALLPLPGLQADPLWDDLRVHFSPLGPLNGFYKLPRTAAEARKQSYTQPPEETQTDIEILCPSNDPSVCIIYDKQGNVGGIQIGLLRSDVDNKGYPYERHPMFVPKTRFGYDTYITTLYFVEQDVLVSGGRKSLAECGTGTGLWLQNGTNRDNLFVVPRLEVDIATKTAFTKENCVPGMGGHYYYNISTSLACEDFEPIFALVNLGKLIGFGFQTFGKPTPINKVWYESIPAAAVRPTIPNAPQCLVDKAKTVGIVSLHVYFIDKPWTIACL